MLPQTLIVIAPFYALASADISARTPDAPVHVKHMNGNGAANWLHRLPSSPAQQRIERAQSRQAPDMVIENLIRSTQKPPRLKKSFGLINDYSQPVTRLPFLATTRIYFGRAS